MAFQHTSTTRAFNVLYNCDIENFFLKALVNEISGDEVFLVLLFPRQDLRVLYKDLDCIAFALAQAFTRKMKLEHSHVLIARY